MADPTPNRPPLWVLMPEAFTNSAKKGGPAWTCRDGTAAELRAIAEEVDRRVAQCLDDDPVEIATWLRTEADRAEAGG